MLSQKEKFFRALKLAHVYCATCEKDFDGCDKCWVYWMMNEIVKD